MRSRDERYEEDRRVSVRALFAIAMIIAAFGVLVLWGPWKDLRETAGYAASVKTDNR